MRPGSIFLMTIVITLSLFFQAEVVFLQESQRFTLPEVFEYPPVKERDPFSPLVQPEEKSGKIPEKKPEKKPPQVITESVYKVVGIVWNEGEDMALITKGANNIWIAKEGMVLDGLKVARIEGEKGEVILIGEDKIIKLKMLGV